jgi:trehalose 6-phosphate synthase/phosphatase
MAKPLSRQDSEASMHMSLTEADKVIIVAHHLPLKIERAPAGGFIIAWDDERGLDKNGMKLPTDTTYIGCIELEVTDMVEQEQLEKELLDKWGCIVVFLEPEMKNRYYHGFCRGYLSPIMHNQLHIPQAEDPFKPDEWRAYCQVNQLFATKVLEVYEQGAMIWIHDYQ